MSVGWYFTALSIVTGSAGSMAVWTVRTKGMKGRSARVAQITWAGIRSGYEATGPEEDICQCVTLDKPKRTVRYQGYE